MRHARRNVQRIARFAAIGGLVSGGLMVSHAVASETSDESQAPNAETRAARTGQELVSDLGTSRTAGSWIDAKGRPVVAVTDEKAATAVRDAGAVAKVVPYAMNDLRSTTAALKDAPRVAGTSWSMDYASNQVVVRADTTVSAAEWDRIAKVAESLGKTVRMERTEGTFTPRLNGAAPLFGGSGRCSAGFNVTNGQANFILTAGHCGPVGTTWFADQQGSEQVGATVTGSFPGGDFSLVQYGPGTVLSGADIVAVGNGQGIRIVGAADPAVGQKVFRSGSTTGLQSGEVTGLNATVNYPQGTVTGLIETTVCAEPGDSGGPMFADGLALGVTSGGNGDCQKGGTTFFQPVTKALDSLGVTLASDPAGNQATPSAGNTGSANSGSGAAVPPGTSSAAPGAVLPGAGGSGSGGQTDSVASALERVADFKSLGPGLFVIAGSLVALVALRIRSERGRRRYRNEYSQSWG
ncbi:S1 family peptidase [Streptomyces sp. NBC_00878]|uniref:S1 family peptidase n=1 Tax=Streptomyces sp. NBC_00878 TaxID=2975854 RepID=UPI00224EE182|nr:S1 family peptidase [Streptomyces sp. NBC_00878]MCX4903083.1 S1 family peptidase [Streptomyces sp. NBC_00878]